MSSEFITVFMFATMMVLLMTGQRVFGVIGFVGTAAALWLWGEGAFEMPFNASFQVLNWYPLITVPFFIFMGYMLSESGIASNLYRMFHVWFGPVQRRPRARHDRSDGADRRAQRPVASPAWRSARPSRCPSCCAAATTRSW